MQTNNNEVNVQRSARSNIGQIERIIIGCGGKDYQSYRSKQFAQMIQRKNNKRQTHKARAMLLTREVRKGQYDRHQFFQMALGDTYFCHHKLIQEKGSRSLGKGQSAQ